VADTATLVDFIVIPAMFYIVVLAGRMDLAHLREDGWVFDMGPAGHEPWYKFYSFLGKCFAWFWFLSNEDFHFKQISTLSASGRCGPPSRHNLLCKKERKIRVVLLLKEVKLTDCSSTFYIPLSMFLRWVRPLDWFVNER
jgi:hypothetical protein